MKAYYFILLFVCILTTKGYSQNIDVLKFNKNEVALKLEDNQILEIKLPLYTYNMSLGDIQLSDSFILKNNQKIGKFNKNKLKLNDGKRLYSYRQGNKYYVVNGFSKNNRKVYAKADLKFNENFNYLEKITITENNFEDRHLIEAMMVVRIIENLTIVKKDTSDDYNFGVAIGTIIANIK